MCKNLKGDVGYGSWWAYKQTLVAVLVSLCVHSNTLPFATNIDKKTRYEYEGGMCLVFQISIKGQIGRTTYNKSLYSCRQIFLIIARRLLTWKQATMNKSSHSVLHLLMFRVLTNQTASSATEMKNVHQGFVEWCYLAAYLLSVWGESNHLTFRGFIHPKHLFFQDSKTVTV